MKNALSFVLFGALICATNALSAQESQKVQLTWKLETGDQFEVKFEQKQSVLTRIDVRDRTLDSELILGCDWKVTDVTEQGDATIEQTISRIRVRTGAPGAELKKVVDVDTASDVRVRGVSRDMIKLIDSLVGLKFTVVLSPVGKVLDVTPDANVAAAAAALPKTSALPRLFTVSAMKQLISDSAFLLSDKKVGAGDSWNGDSTVRLTANDGRVYSFDRVVKSTVKSIDQQRANIDVEITLTQGPMPAAKVESALTSPLELLSFTGGGEVVFDRSQGIVASSDLTSQTKTRVIYREDQVKTTIDVTNRLTVSKR